MAAVLAVAPMWEACHTDECGQVFAASMQASQMPFGASILEIGSAEFNWLRIASQTFPDAKVIGIDWRGSDPLNGEVIKGDVLTHDFSLESFDTVVALSTIEHIGLGHYKNDPKDADGDTKTLQRVWSWLKPGGYLYFDVPWNAAPYEVVGTKFRCYDDEQHEARLHQMPWKKLWRGWFARERPRVQLLTERPTTVLSPGHKQFYHYASVWQKA
jgi:SAM-dependent methyltransferase